MLGGSGSLLKGIASRGDRGVACKGGEEEVDGIKLLIPHNVFD